MNLLFILICIRSIRTLLFHYINAHIGNRSNLYTNAQDTYHDLLDPKHIGSHPEVFRLTI